MHCSFEDYLKLPKAITFEECIKLHQEILDSIDGDEDAVEMYNYLIEKATDYAVIRSNWTTKDRDWKLNEDPRRTATHDVLINNLNMLARYLKSLGKTTNWRESLGQVEEDPINRKRIGDFGCYLVFIHALHGR